MLRGDHLALMLRGETRRRWPNRRLSRAFGENRPRVTSRCGMRVADASTRCGPRPEFTGFAEEPIVTVNDTVACIFLLFSDPGHAGRTRRVSREWATQIHRARYFAGVK